MSLEIPEYMFGCEFFRCSNSQSVQEGSSFIFGESYRLESREHFFIGEFSDSKKFRRMKLMVSKFLGGECEVSHAGTPEFRDNCASSERCGDISRKASDIGAG